MASYDIDIDYISEEGHVGIICTSYNMKDGGQDAEENAVVESWLRRMSIKNRTVKRLKIKERVKGFKP